MSSTRYESFIQRLSFFSMPRKFVTEPFFIAARDDGCGRFLPGLFSRLYHILYGYGARYLGLQLGVQGPLLKACTDRVASQISQNLELPTLPQ